MRFGIIEAISTGCNRSAVDRVFPPCGECFLAFLSLSSEIDAEHSNAVRIDFTRKLSALASSACLVESYWAEMGFAIMLLLELMYTAWPRRAYKVSSLRPIR